MKDKAVWEGAAKDEAISYLKEMLKSPTSLFGLLGAVTAGALLSIPLGPAMGLIPLLGFGAAESIAALFIPSSPVFRAKVNARKRRERREQARQHLWEQIQAKVPADDPHWEKYHRMRERLSSLETLAASRDSSFTGDMVAKLDDATVDYLGLWVAWLAMADRWSGSDAHALEARINKIDAQMDRMENPVERKRLQKARADLQRILDRRDRLWSQSTAVEAAMLSMADTFEEVYQRVVTNPQSAEASAELNQAVERMRIEEELDLAVDEELGSLFKKRQGAKRAAAVGKKL